MDAGRLVLPYHCWSIISHSLDMLETTGTCIVKVLMKQRPNALAQAVIGTVEQV
jgi:hypothetical protein